MADKQERQLTECIGIREYTDRNGEIRKSGVFDLEGEEFELPFRRNFTPEKGRFYSFRVFVAEKALISKRTGEPYISRYLSATLHEVK